MGVLYVFSGVNRDPRMYPGGAPNELEGASAHHFLPLSPHMLMRNGIIKNTLSRCIYFMVEWLEGFAASCLLSAHTFGVCVC